MATASNTRERKAQEAEEYLALARSFEQAFQNEAIATVWEKIKQQAIREISALCPKPNSPMPEEERQLRQQAACLRLGVIDDFLAEVKKMRDDLARHRAKEEKRN